MLTNRQIKLLQLLDTQVKNCTNCELHNNGVAIPHWTRNSQFAIVGEAPGYNEVRKQTPFVGAAGKILTDTLGDVGFKSSQFLIINSVQCRPVEDNRNAKPTEGQIQICQQWFRKYMKIINPIKVLCLGNYAKYAFAGTGHISGILRERGHFRELQPTWDNKEYNVLYTVHPAYCIYNREEGRTLLEQDIKLFYETEFERESDWLLSEDDFRI